MCFFQLAKKFSLITFDYLMSDVSTVNAISEDNLFFIFYLLKTGLEVKFPELPVFA